MRCLSWRSTFTTSFLAVLALSATPQTSGRGAFFQGPAAGILDRLPPGAPNGYMMGSLDDVSGPGMVYVLSASLVELGVACPACFAGLIDGTLDDGIGPGPDFLVMGSYYGTLPDGTGTFRAAVLRPGGALAGRITGRLADPPETSQPGIFRGRWRLQR